MEGGDLYDYIHNKKDLILDWKMIVKIASDIAEGKFTRKQVC